MHGFKCIACDGDAVAFIKFLVEDKTLETSVGVIPLCAYHYTENVDRAIQLRKLFASRTIFEQGSAKEKETKQNEV